MSRSRVLFVDDDPQILAELRRTLEPMRDEWEMDFAGGGSEALQLLETTQFDVVVTDMRMPGMTGAQLLDQVCRKYPNTIRIVLTGQADQSDIQAINSAHQYLAKPCETGALVGAIQRAGATDQLRESPELKAFVNSMTGLPSQPALYTRLCQIADSQDGSAADMAAVIERDPAMTVKILQVANSSYFGLAEPVTDIRRATTLLGADTVTSVALAAQVFESSAALEHAGVNVNELWRRSMSIAAIAKKIASLEQQPDQIANMCFTAGLIAGIGTLTLAVADPDLYRTASEAGSLDEATERELFGVSATAVAGHLLATWGLPPVIVEAVSFQRHPSRLAPATGFRPLLAVHVAAAFDPGTGTLDLDDDYIAAHDVAARVPVWQEALTGENATAA